MVNLEMAVMLVDDVAPVRRTIRGVLQQIGFKNIDDSADAPTALAKMRDRSFGLVISDWNMEPLSGLDFLKAVRADDQLKDTPFIMVTALGGEQNVLAAKEAGVNGYIVKPFNASTLKKKIEGVLGAFA
ncbi:MAG: response regulator [Alphaproteobacteria bacterium]